MKAKRLIVDVRTGRKRVETFDFTPPKTVEREEIGVDLKELKELLNYAKKQGWIKG